VVLFWCGFNRFIGWFPFPYWNCERLGSGCWTSLGFPWAFFLNKKVLLCFGGGWWKILRQCLSLSHTHTHSNTHSHIHTHTRIYLLTHNLSLSFTHTGTHTLSQRNTHTHSFFLTHTHTIFLSLSPPSSAPALSLPLALSLFFACFFSPSLFLSQTHKNTHTHADTLFLSHTHTLYVLHAF